MSKSHRRWVRIPLAKLWTGVHRTGVPLYGSGVAARRLLAVMLIFLAISTVLAILAPPPVENGSTTRTTTSADPGPKPIRDGDLIQRTVEVRDRGDGPEADPGQITASVGDQIALTIAVEKPLTIEAPSLGIVQTAVPGSPARLDLYASAPGRHEILDAVTDQRLVQVRVEPHSTSRENRRNEPDLATTVERDNEKQ